MTIEIPSSPSTSSMLNGFSTEGEGPSELERNLEVENDLRVHWHTSVGSDHFLGISKF